jgi:hypothetical protein
MAEKFYQGYGMEKFHNVHRGIVTELTDDGFIIETRNDEILFVIITPKTRFLFQGDIEITNKVIILGEIDNGIITAIGISKANDKIGFLPKKNTPMRLHK